MRGYHARMNLHDRTTELRKTLATLQFVTDGLTDGAVSMFVDGEEMKSSDAEARAKVLARAKAGEINSLEVEATTFVQRPVEHNRKHVRVAPRAMARLAASFKGMPVLRDHAHDQVDARIGTIISSRLDRVETSAGTEYRIVQRMRIVKQWAIESVLDGTLDRFSVSWLRAGPVMCSVHDSPIFTKCYCLPGSEVDAGGGVKASAEWVYTAADGVEASFVNVPAVAWTTIDAVKELTTGLDVASLTGMLGVDIHSAGARPMFDKLAKILKLAATASEEDLIAAVERVVAEATESHSRSTIAGEQLAEARASIAEMAATIESLRSAASASHVDGAIANLIARGKVKPGIKGDDGKVKPGKVEEELRAMAGRSIALFDAQVAEMLDAPSITPLGAPIVAAKPGPGPADGGEPSTVDEALEANPELKAYLQRAGVKREEFERFGMRKLLELQALSE